MNRILPMGRLASNAPMTGVSITRATGNPRAARSQLQNEPFEVGGRRALVCLARASRDAALRHHQHLSKDTKSANPTANSPFPDA